MDQLWRTNFKEKLRYDDVPFPATKISLVIRHLIVTGLTVWTINGPVFAEEIAAFTDLSSQQQSQQPDAAAPVVNAIPAVRPIVSTSPTAVAVPAAEAAAPRPVATPASSNFNTRPYNAPAAVLESNPEPEEPSQSAMTESLTATYGSAPLPMPSAAVYDAPTDDAYGDAAGLLGESAATMVSDVGSAVSTESELVAETAAIEPHAKRRRLSNLFGLLDSSDGDTVVDESLDVTDHTVVVSDDMPIVIPDDPNAPVTVASVTPHDPRALSDEDMNRLYRSRPRYATRGGEDEVALFQTNPAETYEQTPAVEQSTPVEVITTQAPAPVAPTPVVVATPKTSPPPATRPMVVRRPSAPNTGPSPQATVIDTDSSSVSSASSPKGPVYPVQSEPADVDSQGTNQRNIFNLFGILGTGKGASPADGIRSSTSDPLPVETSPTEAKTPVVQSSDSVSGYVSANEYHARQTAEKAAASSSNVALPTRRGDYDELVRDIDSSSEYAPNQMPSITSYGRSSGALRDAYAQWLGDEGDILSELEKQPPIPEHMIRSIMLNAVEQASTRSPLITQVRAEWEAAQYDVDEAKGRRLPQIQVGGVTKSWGGGDYYDNNPNTGGINVGVTTSVYDFGYNRKNIQSRKEMATAGEYKFSLANEDNAYQVCSNLVELSKNKLILEVNRVFVKRMQTLVNMLADIVKVDGGRASELTQARARLLQAQTAEETVAARVRDLEIALRKLIGPVIEPLPPVLHWEMPIVKLEDAIEASRRSSAILQLDSEALSADSNADAVRASTMPRLNWLINKSTVEDTYGRERDWETSLAVSWDIFQGGSGRASERAARSRAAASLQRKEQMLLDSEFDLRQAHHNAVTNYERSEQYTDLSQETARVRQMFFEQWYHLGKRTLLDVLIAENDHNSNQVGEITTKYDAYQSVLQMYSTSGSLQSWLRQMY